MSGIKVSDRVIITDLKGNKYHGVVANINDFREPCMKYAIDIKGFDDVVFVGEEQIEKEDAQNANPAN